MAASIVSFKKITLAKFTALTTKDNSTFYRVALESGKEDFYLGDKKLNNTQDITDAINALDTTADVVIASVADGVVTLHKAIKEENGIVSAVSGEGATIAFAKVATTGAASDVTTKEIKVGATGSETTFAAAGNVQSVLETIAAKVNSVDADAKVTVTKTAGTDKDSFVSKYTFSQGGKAIENGEITIGKDLVATSGELVEADGEGTEGTFIKMTIANGTPFYIDVKDLIEYNSYEDTDEVKAVAVTDKTHTYKFEIGKINATKIVYKVVEGKETTVKDELDAINAKVTTSIGDLNGEATIASKTGNKVSIKAGIVETNGKIKNNESADITLADVAATGKAADVAIGNTVSVYEADKVVNVDQALDAVAAKATADIAKAISDLDTTADVPVASEKAGVVTIKGSIKEEDGIVKTGTAADVVLNKVATSGAAADVAYVNNGANLNTQLTATTAQGAIDELVGYKTDTAESTSIEGAKKYADAAVAAAFVWEEVE